MNSGNGSVQRQNGMLDNQKYLKQRKQKQNISDC